jgi:hypothetical protein
VPEKKAPKPSGPNGPTITGGGGGGGDLDKELPDGKPEDSLTPLEGDVTGLILILGDLNSRIKRGELTNCEGFAAFAAAALNSGPTGVAEAARLITPTANGGAGNIFAASANGGGWKTPYLDTTKRPGTPNSQAHHAMAFFSIGYYGAVTPDSATTLAMASYAREFADAYAVAPGHLTLRSNSSIASRVAWAASNINWGDYNLGVAAGLAGGAIATGSVDRSGAESTIRGTLCN